MLLIREHLLQNKASILKEKLKLSLKIYVLLYLPMSESCYIMVLFGKQAMKFFIFSVFMTVKVWRKNLIII